MSFPSLDNLTPTISPAELHAAASAAGISISDRDLPAYLSFASAFDKSCTEVLALPPYAEPRLAPIATHQPRSFLTPSPASNPLNAWSQQCSLTATHPTSTLLAGKTVAMKANIAVAGADLNIGTSARFFPAGRFHVPDVDATVVRRVLLAGAEIRGTGTCENFSLCPVSGTAETGAVGNAWDGSRVTGGSSSGVATLVSLRDVEAAEGRGHGEGEGVDLAIGGDQGGSIRLPAHFGGIYGLKPTFGLVPYTGAASLFSAVDHLGPMGRSIEDVALLLEAIAGADGIDFRQSPWTPLRENVPSYQQLLESWVQQRQGDGQWGTSNAASGLRIGVLDEGWKVAGLDPDVADCVKRAVERYRSLGAEVVPVSVPLHLYAGMLWSVGIRHALVDCLTNKPSSMLGYPLPGFSPLTSTAANCPSTTQRQSSDSPSAPPSKSSTIQDFFDYITPINPAISNALLNAPLLAQKYGADLSRKAQLHIHELTAAYDAVLADNGLDALVLPVSGNVALKIPDAVGREEVDVPSAAFPSSATGTTGAEDRWKGVTRLTTTNDAASAAKGFVGVTLNTSGFNLSGHPAMSIPCGWVMPKDGNGPAGVTGGRMPVGMQIVGRKWDELGVLKVAKAWEAGGGGIDQVMKR